MSSLSILGTAIALTIGTTLLVTDNAISIPNNDTLLTQATSRPDRQRRARGGDNLIEQLNLTDDQKRQIATIRQKYQGQMSQLRQSMKSDRQELEALMTGNATDTRIRAKHREIEQNRQQLSDLRFQSLLEMRRVLTPEQRTRFAELMQQRRARAGGDR
jgi:Spy/CpxP family protein refolding chaperone